MVHSTRGTTRERREPNQTALLSFSLPIEVFATIPLTLPSPPLGERRKVRGWFANRSYRAARATKKEHTSLYQCHVVRCSMKRIIGLVVNKMATAIGRARDSVMEWRKPCRSQDSVIST